MKHLSSLVALLVYQFVTNLLQAREASLNNLVKLIPAGILSPFESVCAASGEETLKASEDRRWVVAVEELQSDVHEAGPLAGKIEVKDTLN